MLEIRISDDELPGLFRDGDEDYVVGLDQVPLVVEALRNLADKLESEFGKADKL